jgi:hypothetical protein
VTFACRSTATTSSEFSSSAGEFAGLVAEQDAVAVSTRPGALDSGEDRFDSLVGDILGFVKGADVGGDEGFDAMAHAFGGLAE